MTPEQAADKIYAVTGVILGTDAARHIASYLSVMETRIAELEAALRQIEYLDRPQVRGLPRRKTIQEIACAALAGGKDE